MLAVLLSFVILWQSIPVSALADALSSKKQEVSLPEISETELTEESSKAIPFILGEMTEMRTLDTKVFRMSDGSYSAGKTGDGTVS